MFNVRFLATELKGVNAFHPKLEVRAPPERAAGPLLAPCARAPCPPLARLPFMLPCPAVFSQCAALRGYTCTWAHAWAHACAMHSSCMHLDVDTAGKAAHSDAALP